jgi:hypothetical protein
MEREAYEGADPEDIDGGAGPSRKSSSSSRRRGSDTEEASDFGSGLPAGTSAAHARAIAQAAKPKSHARKMSAGHILRPRNAFIIFRSTMIKEGQITENMEASCLSIGWMFKSNIFYIAERPRQYFDNLWYPVEKVVAYREAQVPAHGRPRKGGTPSRQPRL